MYTRVESRIEENNEGAGDLVRRVAVDRHVIDRFRQDRRLESRLQHHQA